MNDVHNSAVGRLLRKATFMLGAASAKQFPVDSGMEVAFAGRSNVGKSSALNRIANQKHLARTSKTPGRTQQINFFSMDEQRRLVDLPGYGFADVPREVQQQWALLIEGYLTERQCLRGVVVLMDARRLLTDYDEQMLSWCQAAGLPVHVLLTKIDKLTRNQGNAARAALAKLVGDKFPAYVPRYGGPSRGISVQTFSATDGTGLDVALRQLGEWFLVQESG